MAATIGSSPGPQIPTSRFPLVQVLILLAGVWAYHNSFTGPFIFDDQHVIVNNAHLRHLWPIWDTVSVPLWAAAAWRPVVNLTFAINYALGGLDVRGYHVTNLFIHIAAALTLAGVVRRLLLSPRVRDRCEREAAWVAGAVALLWVVHPLQTESVDYLCQRAESLMGLWYVVTLYAVIRGATATNSRGWSVIAVLACALGMATKPVMVTAPVTALLCDRVFFADSIGQAWTRRRGLYLGLLASWSVLIGLAIFAWKAYGPSAGFAFHRMTPLDYALTQPGVIVHYLRLALWPAPLCFDYVWPVARTPAAIVPPLLVVSSLVGATLWALRVYPSLGFVGAWCVLTLAPTSSILPITDLAAEHRLYLPLAGVMVLLVMGALVLLRPLERRHAAVRRWIAGGVVGLVVLGLGSLTIRRNAVYRSEITLWADVVAHRPGNARAHNNLGNGFEKTGNLQAAATHYTEAFRLDPAYAEAHNNLGDILAQQGRAPEALTQFVEAIRLKPSLPDSYNNLGNLLLREAKVPEAVLEYEQALRLNPNYPEAQNNLGVALWQQQRGQEALPHFTEAVRLDPAFAEAHRNLGIALVAQDRPAEAAQQFAIAQQLSHTSDRSTSRQQP